MGGTQVGRTIRERVHAPKGVNWWAFAGAVAFAVGLGALALALGGSSLPLALQVPLAAITVAPWIPNYEQRWVSWKFVLAAIVPTLVLTWTGGSPVWFGLLALSASRVAISTTVPRSVCFGVVAVAVVVGRQFVAGYDLDWMMWKTYVELGLALGWVMRSRRLLVARTNENREEHAQLAALEERRRIARDIHDVLAHTLTILMVHLNSARLSVRDDPEGTAELLDEVASYGRYCLEEIRTTVGLLSTPPSAARAATPIEAANAIEELVASYRKAGADIDLRLNVGMEHMGLLAQALPVMWHSGYRIVQESLANAVRHAPDAPIEVRIGVDDTGLHLYCANPVRGGIALELPSGGNGVRGMRERADALGGRVDAGIEGSTWVVRAELPLLKGGSEHRPAEETLGRAS